MVDYCANPKCMKPLHYLREGVVYLFETPSSEWNASVQPGHRLQHYWLCGECCAGHLLERTANQELRLVARQSSRFVKHQVPVVTRALAS